jgi:Domain of unknown function (DUF5801)
MALTNSIPARTTATNALIDPENLSSSAQANDYPFCNFIGNPDDVSYWQTNNQTADQANQSSLAPSSQTISLAQVSLLTATGNTVILDESSGLQNLVDAASILGDAVDNDISTTVVSATSAVAPLLTFLSGLGLGDPINFALSGYDGANSGLNVVNTSETAELAFTDGAGAALNGFATTLMTASGVPIFLYTAALDSHIVIGREGMMIGSSYVADPSGAVVMTGYLQPVADGAKLWTALYEPLHHNTAGSTPAAHDDAVDLTNQLYITASVENFFTLENAPPGQNLFLMLGNADSSLGIVVTGKNPANQSDGAKIITGDTVNTSLATGTTIGTNNQAIDPPSKNGTPGEGMYFTFVKSPVLNYTIPELDQNEADKEENIQFGNGGGLYAEQTSASFLISQMTPGKMGTVKISAFETSSQPGADFISGTGLVNDAQITIDATNVLVYTISSTGEHIPVSGVSITQSGGSVIIKGVTSQTVIEYHTLNGAMHNRLLVENMGDSNAAYNSSFDIGWISMGRTSTETVEVGSRMVFEDDGPSVSTTGTLPALMVDETDLATDDTGDFSDNFLAVFGNDGAKMPLAYTLDVSSPGAETTLTDTASGHKVYLFLESGVVVGREGTDAGDAASGDVVLQISVSGAGVVTLNQLRAVMHPDATDPDDSIGMGAADLVQLIATATDQDDDTDTATLNIADRFTFKDDGPSAFAPGAVSLSNTGTDAETGDLDFIGHSGADQPGNIYFVDNVPADNYLRNSGSGDLLTSGMENIVLSGFGTGVLTAKTENSLQTVFTATLTPGSDQYTIDFDLPFDDGSGLIILGAAPLKSGNVAYNLINDVSGSALDILFSGTVQGTTTVNVSTQGAGVGNQTMNAGENLRLDFVVNGTLDSKATAFSYAEHQAINGFEFYFSQNTPSGSNREGTVYVRAFDDTDGDLNLTNGTTDPITKIMIGDQVLVDGGTLNTLTINGHQVSAMLYQGGVVITGLNEGATGDAAGGDDPLIKVYTADGFDRVEIANYSGISLDGGATTLAGDNFDVAVYGIEQTQQGTPIDFTLPVQIADADFDTTPVALIGVHLDPVI